MNSISVVYASVLRTTDGGENWERTNFQINKSIGLIDVSAVDAMTCWVVGTEGQAHRTVDGGETWSSSQVIVSLFHVNGVCAIDADTAYAATDQGGVHATTDGGNTWDNISPTYEDIPGIEGYELLGITTKDGQSIWIASTFFGNPDGKIIHTGDGGATWVEQDTPLSGVNFDRISFAGANK